MKAITQNAYGSPEVLELSDIDQPVAHDDAVLLRVHAAAVNPYDWHVMRADPHLVRLMGLALRRPKNSVRGVDVAGRVEAVGTSVRRFRPGDEVFGLCYPGEGAFAEYACTQEGRLAPKPHNLTFEQAAAVPVAALTALGCLRDVGRPRPGQMVLVNGASGGVGTFAVQLARSFDAEVTGVCSTKNVDLVRSLGADHVIDYTREDLTRNRRRYDVVLDNVGNHSVAQFRSMLAPGGKHILNNGAGGRWFGPAWRLLDGAVRSVFADRKTVSGRMTEQTEDLVLLKELLEAGTITPVIDRTYPLSRTPEAIRYLERGHARGKVIIAG
ncbi:MAG: NAD(P)-dependent alcohol dehydrogenase [Dactylosporangium sp.]|nr:NAD(P)-dependent alcohol dehydrogenase [Dactylosporangium sp.]NNJ63849.1 NAD(P)-dependent alcohol dehydrogenase [Dactylosporangium sp.]